jgi:ketosteroid isomerase-like protein
MKDLLVVLSVLWALAVPAQSQDIFDALRKGDIQTVKALEVFSPDGKYLFFLSQRDGESHAYWARADVIDKARSKPGRENLSDAEELRAIEQSIRDCIGWAKTKDFGRLYSVIANDSDFLEVHPDGKVVKGFDEFRQAEKIWKSPDFKAVRYEIRDLRIKLSRSREVAWFYCVLDDINEWKGQPANWENTRWTGVLENRDGLWVMVQQHFSK